MKLVIGDSKSKKSFQVDISKENESLLIGKKIGDEFDGSALGASGYTLQVTGGTDIAGFPMRKDVEGPRRKKLLLSNGPGFKPKEKGERSKKVVRGNIISDEIQQINCKVKTAGPKPLEELVGKKEGEEKKEEKNQNRHGMRIEHFDQWVFRNQLKVAGAGKQLLERLKSEADSIQSTCQLTDDQKDKLALAGRGDIQAFMQQYYVIRAKFEKNIHDQQAIQKIWQEIQPLQMKYNGQIFGEKSLFAKVLEHLLDEQQMARMQELRRQQRLFQYQAAVRQLMIKLDQVAPITHEKREQLIALIDKHTFPPKSMSGNNQSHFLMYYVLGQLAEIPEKELRPIFRPAAWKGLQAQIKQGRGMKRQLKQQGMVPDKG